MGSRTTLLAVVAALAFSTPAYAQSDPPPALFDAAPAEDAGPADPTDGGRSVLLLGLALVTVAGAGLLLGLALRPRRRAPAPAPAVAPPVAARVVMYEPEFEPEPEQPVWHPRVHSDLPPLPAFGSERPPEPGGP